MKFDQVETYLKEYRLGEHPYDPVGALYLLKAIVKNIKENFMEEDFHAHHDVLDKNDKEILKRLMEGRMK